MPKAEVKKAGVLGWPVGHSLSPRLHGYWLKQYDIQGSYEAIAVEPGDLKRILRELPEKRFVGVNLTVPHKEQAIDIIDEFDEKASRTGAVNTIVVKGGKLIGSNTDIFGFTQNFKAHHVSFKDRSALVIGAGGAARAICAGFFAEGGAHITLINRTFEKAEALADGFSGKVGAIEWNAYADAMQNISLLINTTPLGMTGQPPLELSLETLPKDAVVTDIVYNPILTPLLASARARGNPIVDGLGMLLYQAQPAFEAFFGVKPEITPALCKHVLEGLP